ncbi:hypothetical protein TCAL_05228 [Tigriopus californicus]|uniref:Amine oxidase domain-containing protein n=1 Tax=Tigriopus californicus TaxID=6832 RepID=A0A553NU37_TIGCA|nr:spermine oxidase-like [Tigriopus californicus]TRY68923.1 hypothetical protein TCAL_05228 [Tigriopus californicus]|eukprot:TCALIF_05228-PA protein Name:"Similar to Smox Spermine oxidase (Mus musculus)" AED:0.08 eAED:0.08 QI:233/0.66/0.5/1/1/1/4/0/576
MNGIGSKKCHKVVVIGAGMAGISAAHYLVENGVSDVILVEASDRIGGRIQTIFREGKPLELGAEWIFGGCPSNSLFNLANRLKLLGREIQRLNDIDETVQWPNTVGYIYRSNGLPLSEESTQKAYEVFNAIRDEIQGYFQKEYKVAGEEMQRKGRASVDVSTAAFEKTRLLTFYDSRVLKALAYLKVNEKFAAVNLKQVEAALSGFRNTLSISLGEDLDQIRLELTGSSVHLPGGNILVPGGMVGVLEALVQDLPKNSLRFGRKVTGIDWSFHSRDPLLMDKIHVECSVQTNMGSQTEDYFADYVVSTLPLGVLRHQFSRLFHPALPSSKVQAVQSIGCGHMSKIFLEFLSPWWAPGEGGITLAWTNEELRHRMLPRDWYLYISHFSEVEGHPNLLACWIASSGARIADQLSNSDLMDRIIWVLQKFTGDPGLPGPVKLFRATWSTMDNFLGSTSFSQLATEEADFHELSQPLPSATSPRLLFAGEATHSRYWGTLHGARLSGIREAKRVLDRITEVDILAAKMTQMATSPPPTPPHNAGYKKPPLPPPSPSNFRASMKTGNHVRFRLDRFGGSPG